MSNSIKRRRLSADGQAEVTKSADSDPQPLPKPAITQGDEDSKDQRRTLFVRSLPATVTTERLTEFFSQSRPLKHATVVLDPQTKASKGYGFVTFADAEDAQSAVTEFDKVKFDGRNIKVELADSRHRDVPEEGGKSKPSAKAIEQKAQRDLQRTEALPPKLIIRNLPWSIKKPEDLAFLFRSYGKVKKSILPQKNSNQQAGFGFVVLRGRKNAEKAMEGVNGKIVDGRPLAVDWAVAKETWEQLQSKEQDESVVEKIDSNGEHGINGIDATPGDVFSESDDQDTDSEDLDGEGGALIEPESEDAVPEDGSEDIDMADDEPEEAPSNTIFIRNLPFTSTDETLNSFASRFGPVRYARVVIDPETERSKGTGFVCFFNEDDAKSCVKNAPKASSSLPVPSTADKKRKGESLAHSVLQDVATDPTGRYQLEGRLLQISRALSRSDATRREAEGSTKREGLDRDKRRLYLLGEGTIPRGSKLYETLGPTEINIRDASTKQRQKLVKSNPSLHMSLTRLSVRNIPRSVTSKDLKALAREAVVGFATDVKDGLRQPLSREELRRAGDNMRDAERQRKQRQKGIVKQAKIVFEGKEGTIVGEKTGAGRSRGYGFIEYMSHRSALMGLRWLNGHAVDGGGPDDRRKRLLVEFAVENAQVVLRRKDREIKIKARTGHGQHGSRPGRNLSHNTGTRAKLPAGREDAAERGHGRGAKRKRDAKTDDGRKPERPEKSIVAGSDDKNKLAMRNRIISRKRIMRKSRKG